MQVILKDIRKYFGSVKANDGINLTFDGGHIYGLLGENGAGKSTLMKILSGYQPCDSGEIILDGNVMDFTSPAEALQVGVGMLYQDPLDFPPFNVLENILLEKKAPFLLDFRQAARRIQDLAKHYEFDVDIRAEIHSLSLGERQQLELVRLLAGGAQILVLDEPTTGISAEQKEKLFASMRRMAYDEGKILILVSHKLEEVQELCDQVFVLRKGKLVGELMIPCPNENLVQMMFGELPVRKERTGKVSVETILEVKDLNIDTYRITVEDVSFEVHKGEVFGFAGLEGSGQSLVLKAIAGLEKADKGSIVLDGEEINRVGYHAVCEKGVALIGAGRLEEGLVAGLSLTEHMVLAAPEHDFIINWKDAQKRTSEQIQQYQVIGSSGSMVDQLSGGNQQRFMFAMLNSPLKLILLEHPTRGLDVRSTDWIWEQLYKRRQEGTAIIFLSADLDEVVDRSDRIAVFFGGRMSRIVNASETSVDELGHMIGGQL